MKERKIDNPLVEEVLTDMAGNFFGARTHLEDMIEMFYAYIERLREKDLEVSARAGFINNLLLNKEGAEQFYKAIKIDSPEVLSECPFSDEVLPEKMPFSFTERGVFINLILWAYGRLQKLCDEYINGLRFDDSEETSIYRKNIYFKLVKSMCDIINKEVQEVNTSMPPFALLQYVRQFDPEVESHEHIAIPVFSGNAEGINEKLAFKPIPFDSLNIKQYPELQKKEQVESAITSFCKQYYSINREPIQKRILEIKQKIHQKENVDYSD